MELTGNAQRALDQVKMGLYMLYGANYFTEEEWIKIDGLIHKGKYEFTRGPPSNILEEPLMSFEESPTEGEAVVQMPETRPFGETTRDTTVIVEEQISSPSSELADSILSPAESSNETPVESPIDNSDDDSGAQKPSTTEPALPPTSSYDATATSQPSHHDHKPEGNTGISPRYTQAQLDEVRAFNAGLTKAGQKSRPIYDPIEEYPASESADDFRETLPQESSYYSPAPTEQEARINTWADGVDQGPHSSHRPQIQSPTPNHPIPTAPAVEALAEEFTKTHGREPRSLNEFYQPNNPQHHLARPSSRASVMTTKSFKSTAQSIVDRQAHVAPGITLNKVYIAQCGAPRKGIRIEIRPGDPIRVIKFVSGIMYIGDNLRTKQNGQFPDTIFKKDTGAVETPAPSTTFQRGLDAVENVNAAEWDDVSSTRKLATTPAPRAYIGGGLATSRFSVLADREPPIQAPTGPRRDTMPDMAGKIGQIINDRVDEILKARGVTVTAPRAPAKPASKTVHAITPKTETCWFWAVRNECRFTAEECRDLHAFVPNKPGEPSNFRMGKPTWGALADYLPATVPTEQPAPSTSTLNDDDEALKLKGKTCYYWAVEKKCTQTAESCKYLHAHSPLGIAAKPAYYKPNHWKKQWGEFQAKMGGEGSGGGSVEGELLLEEVPEVELDGWGQPIKKPAESTWAAKDVVEDHKYKPPHVKAMEAIEEQLSREAAGW